MKLDPKNPVILAMAEEIARETYEAMRGLPPERGHLPMATWATLRGGRYTDIRIEAQAALLCDLSRPAIRDRWVRWLIADEIEKNRRYWLRYMSRTTLDASKWIKDMDAVFTDKLVSIRDNVEELTAFLSRLEDSP